MFDVQHIGIPVSDLDKTIRWYGDLGFYPVFRTVLENGDNVAFIEVGDINLEFYTDSSTTPDTPVIDSLHFYSSILEGSFTGPSGEKLLFEKRENNQLKSIWLNSSDLEQTRKDLSHHGFYKDEEYFSKGKVHLRVLERENGNIAPGAVNHIAFNENNLQKRFRSISTQGIPVIEGINTLPFFEKGVSYFVTENHDGLRLEYNTIL